MPFIARQEAFTCMHCGQHVDELKHGSYRNHCPHCLWSKHVDRDGPGDRLSSCGAGMMPTALDQRSKKGWMIIHTCTACGKNIPNVAAPDDDLVGFSTRNPQQE